MNTLRERAGAADALTWLAVYDDDLLAAIAALNEEIAPTEVEASVVDASRL